MTGRDYDTSKPFEHDEAKTMITGGHTCMRHGKYRIEYNRHLGKFRVEEKVPFLVFFERWAPITQWDTVENTVADSAKYGL